MIQTLLLLQHSERIHDTVTQLKSEKKNKGSSHLHTLHKLSTTSWSGHQTWAIIKPKPHTIRDRRSIVKVHKAVITSLQDLNPFGCPPIPTITAHIQVAYTIPTGPLHLERVRRTPLERPRRWVVQPRRVYLVAVGVAEGDADHVSSVPRGRAARLDFHRV